MRRLVLTLTVTCLACPPVSSQPLPLPHELGPFAVGHRRFTLEDASRDNRSFWVDAWYPVEVDDAVGSLATYQAIQGDEFSFPSEVAFDSPPVSPSGEFPLLVFSHGGLFFSAQSSSMTEALASHGFVVVAPNHTGDTIENVFTGFDDNVSAVNRPLDVSFLLDELEDRSQDPQDIFFGNIRTENVGIVGHSFGGYTGLVSHSGSDRLNLPADPRISAVMPISLGIDGVNFSLGEFESTLPTFLVGGTRGDDFNSRRLFSQLDAVPMYLALIEGADHISYADICDRHAYIRANGAPAEVSGIFDFLVDTFRTCQPEAIFNDEAIGLTSLYAVAFFKTHIADDTRYSEFLTADYALNNGLPVRFEAIPVPEPSVRFSTLLLSLVFARWIHHRNRSTS